MASTYSNLLRVELQASGENDSSWGAKANTSMEMLEAGIAARAAVTHDDTANYTLSTANGSTDEARCMILNIGGTLTAARNTVCPTKSKVYVVKNATTGGYATTLKTTAGTGISVPNGKTMILMCDGTNVVSAIDALGFFIVAGPTQARTYTFPDADTTIPALGVTASTAVQTDQAVTAWTRSATSTLGTTLNGTLSDTSTTITAFNGVAGVTYHVRCLGAGAITHHATNLIITQGAASIAATAAGDTFDVEMLTSTTCRIKNYEMATGFSVISPAGNATQNIGYLNVPQNSQNAGYTCVLADSGKHIYMATAGTFTIPANASVAYPIGTAITFVNLTTSCTIPITTDTMYLAGTGTTGTRTLAQYGVATALKVGTTSWIISGSGLT